MIAGAFLIAVLGLGLFLRRRRRKLSKDVAEAIDVDKDVEEPPRIVFHEPPPPPPPPPLPPQTPGAGSPAGLVELDGLAPPPPPPGGPAAEPESDAELLGADHDHGPQFAVQQPGRRRRGAVAR